MSYGVKENEAYEDGFCKICGCSDGALVIDVSEQPDAYAEYLGLGGSARPRYYARCPSCNLVYRNEFYTPEAKQRLYQIFRDEAFRDESHTEYFQRIVSLPPEKSENFEKYIFLERHLPERGIHLDVGGGLGVFSFGFEKHFSKWESYCIEPTPHAGEIATDNGVRFIQGYLETDTQLANGRKFDLITMNHVLEHVDAPADLLATVASFMTASGILYLEVPDQSDCGYLPLEHDRFMSQHEVIFDHQSLSKLVVAAGFKVEHSEVFRSLRGRNNLRLLCRLL